MHEELLTLRQLAEKLEIPESTVRYYRDAFLDHIPSVGTGRRRRYPREAIAVLRSIAAAYASGRSRSEIIAAIHDRGAPATASVERTTNDTPQRTVPVEEVTNLDLLAAILDGEREQRDALWQMAKEIVRLTEVLEGQDKVIAEIADQAGVALEAPRPMAQLQTPSRQDAKPPRNAAAPEAALPAPASPESPALPVSPSSPEVTHIFPSDHEDDHGAPAVEIEPVPRFAAASSSDVEKLKAELESERALVERLRESKLQLEHRAADAEAALEDRRGRRPSMIKRLLGSSEDR